MPMLPPSIHGNQPASCPDRKVVSSVAGHITSRNQSRPVLLTLTLSHEYGVPTVPLAPLVLVRFSKGGLWAWCLFAYLLALFRRSPRCGGFFCFFCLVCILCILWALCRVARESRKRQVV
ncbi:unnamed protein product [Periconia digitata]|uniref:Uncharacterized protein n=1 Tax=Periconia digitata TaxID=1303443 RepID=A0A9W4U4S2_9PLEO|nr:unnamed protein product [Periconia digitata]